MIKGKKIKRKKKIKKFRNWLTKNKVFFEVFSFIFLGIASLIVGWFSYKTSEGQLELQKLEQSPIIHIKKEHNQTYEFLNIYNLGYHMFESEIDYSTYFIIRDFNDSISRIKTDIYFKIGDYFNLNYQTNNTTGNISRISCSEYTQKLSNQLRENLRSEYGNFFRLSEFEHFIRVYYKNNRGNKITKYFLVDSFSIVEISKSTYESKINRYYYHSNQKTKYLNKLNHTELIKDTWEIYNKLQKSDALEPPA